MSEQNEEALGKEQKELRAVQHDMERLFKARDAKGLSELYTAHPPIKSRAEIEKLWIKFLATDSAELHVTFDEVYFCGDLGVENGTYKFTNNDGTVTQNGLFIQTFKRGSDGKWLIHNDFYTC
ncbi:hypothetical protein niasHS_005798 [Heterodera schachtii]|uniref:DUF4440 domain-containing protein n=2 Tax=Heterodera TaxID=34509 RepID=A0ABD2K076_HETSC